MGKKLIITEKPSVARDYAKILGVSGNQKGYIENNEYVISWCVGHLVEMVYPESYDESLKKWRLEDLPFLPKVYKYDVINNVREQYNIVHSLLFREDIDVVYWAGDSGKEGQVIEENIRMYGGVRPGMEELRVWIDSQTDDEIRRGLREARPMSDYDLLGRSGIMRTIEDYSLGINFSRALSVKYGRLINDAAATESYTAIAIGRVMTCVLGMVVRREREIRNFVETPFYRVVGKFSDAGFAGEWKAVEGSRYLDSPLLYKENGFKKKESAEKLISELDGKEAVIKELETGITKKKAPLLFNLAELQSECSKIFKISPAQTLDVIQELYEKKLTTYPRTDARVLTTAVAKEISKNIYGLKKYGPMAHFCDEIINNKRYLGIEKTVYTNDKQVTDHYAIIPTGQTNGVDNLSSLQKSVYELICKRFLAIFYPAAEYSFMKATIGVDTESLFTSAKVLVKPGYMEVLGIPQKKENDEEDDVCSKEDLLKFAQTAKVGDIISVQGYEIKEGKTAPPKRYTSGSLILAMENAGNLIEDEELREQIKKNGIGTSATRGEILEKLVRIKYLNQNPKNQIITPEKLGEMIYEVVFLTVPSLLNPELTANWETGLEGIVNGTVDDAVYRSKLEDYIRKETGKMIGFDLTSQIAANIHEFTGKDSKGAATRKPLGLTCPICGGELNTTSFGYGCSNYFNKEKPCRFSLGKVAEKDIEEDDFRELIQNGKTKILDGFIGKNKRPFKAALKLEKKEDGQYGISFDFDDVPAEYIENLKCPVCGGRICKTGYGFTCEHNTRDDKSCYFSIGEIASKEIDLEQATKLINEGKTDIISGFKSKTKTAFKARLVLNTDEVGRKSIGFDFSDVQPDVIEGVVCPDCGGKILVKSNGFGCENFSTDNPDSCKFYIGKIAQKSLTQANVKELLTTQKTSTIRGFKSKTGKKFDACLILQKNEETGKHNIAFDFDNVEQKTVKDLKCPVCKEGNIVVTPFGYGCSRYNKDNPSESCSFNIGKIAGVKLNAGQVTELVNSGITPVISGFKSKTGKKFDAQIAFNKDDDGKITGCKFVFPEVKEKVLDGLPCPKCNSSIIKSARGYRCANYSREESGCKFYVGAIAGVSIDEEQFRKLLAEKRTDVISGFLSKKGSYFDARLKLDENNNIVFDFDNSAQ